MTINERVKAVRTSPELNRIEKMTLERFGQRLGVTRMAMSNIETGTRNVTEQMFKSICREFNVNPSWLRDGVGRMFLEPSENERITEFINRILTDEPDGVKARFISAVSKFDDRDWETILRVAKELVEEQEEEDEEKKRRQQLHEELDRQLDMEKNQAEESSASEAV